MESNLALLPKLLKAEEVATVWGLSKPQTYDAMKKLPLGVKVYIGKRIRVDADKFREWLAAGGGGAKA